MRSNHSASFHHDKVDKKTAEKHEKILSDLMNEEANKYCADCGQKGTRWASWNLGIFLCIRCGGLHRRLGTHISRVKSVTLDTWTAEQVSSMVSQGNAKVNAIYNPNPERAPPFPRNESDMEQWIRDKYERRHFSSSRNNSGQHSTTSSSLSHSNSTASSRNTSANNSGPYAIELSKLADMGFTDTRLALTALTACDGNISKAIEVLISSSPNVNTEITAPRPGRGMSYSGPSSEVSNHDSDMMRQLSAMGFTNLELNRRILLESKNDLPEAISRLVSLRKESLSTATTLNQPTNTQPLYPPFTTAPTSNNSKASSSDLFGFEFGAAEVTATATNNSSNPSTNPFSASTPALPSNKDAILSLYSQPQVKSNTMWSSPQQQSYQIPQNNYPMAPFAPQQSTYPLQSQQQSMFPPSYAQVYPQQQMPQQPPSTLSNNNPFANVNSVNNSSSFDFNPFQQAPAAIPQTNFSTTQGNNPMNIPPNQYAFWYLIFNRVPRIHAFNNSQQQPPSYSSHDPFQSLNPMMGMSARSAAVPQSVNPNNHSSSISRNQGNQQNSGFLSDSLI